jgi:hypothetical protein
MVEPQTLPCRTCFLTYRRNKLRIDAEGHLRALDKQRVDQFLPSFTTGSEIQMTNRDTSTVEELEQSLAHLLAHSLWRSAELRGSAEIHAAPRRDSAAPCAISKRRVAERTLMQSRDYTQVPRARPDECNSDISTARGSERPRSVSI